MLLTVFSCAMLNIGWGVYKNKRKLDSAQPSYLKKTSFVIPDTKLNDADICKLTSSELETLKDVFYSTCDLNGLTYLNSLLNYFKTCYILKPFSYEKSQKVCSEILKLNFLSFIYTEKPIKWSEFLELIQQNTSLQIASPSAAIHKERSDYFQKLRSVGISAANEIINYIPDTINRLLQSRNYMGRIQEIKSSMEREFERINLQSSTVSQDSRDTQNIASTSMPTTVTNIEDILNKIDKKISTSDQWKAAQRTRYQADATDVEDSETASNLSHNTQSTLHNLIQTRFEPASLDTLQQLQAVFEDEDSQDIVIDKFNIPMTRKKLSCLRPRVWLNDEVINFYMAMLQERDSELCAKYPQRESSHFFNSFFMEKLVVADNQYNYKNVQRWSKKFDIFTKHKIFCPINLHNTHWTLAVVYMKTKEIHYYDSMNGAEMKYLNGLKQWVADESITKKNTVLDMKNWTLHTREPHVPQQHNGCDCGVFSIVCADFISDDLPLSFSQEDMTFFRKKIGATILLGSLSYPLESVRVKDKSNMA